MFLSGHEDLRVGKTIRSIKSAFETLIVEKDYEKITVRELRDIARISKMFFLLILAGAMLLGLAACGSAAPAPATPVPAPETASAAPTEVPKRPQRLRCRRPPPRRRPGAAPW